MRRALATTLLALCTGGCMIGPDYKRPPLDIPLSFQYQSKEAEEASDTEWWRRFQDPVLDGLIAEALANNKSVRIAAANIEAAAGVLTQTRAPLFPQVTYGGNASRQRISENGVTATPGISNPFTTLQLFGGVNWELDLWGRTRRLTEAARAELLASGEARRGAILTLVSSVAGTYMQLRGLDEQLAIARRDLVTYQDSVKLYELQFQYGLISRMVVEQALTQYETAAALIPQFESQIVQTENALSILLGRNPGPIPRGKAITEFGFPAVPSGLPSQLLERRPDLLQAEQNLIAANARIGAARALYFPTISLTGSFGFESTHLSDLFQGPSRIWSFAGSFTGPIFTAGAISGQVRQAEAAEQAALIGYEAAIQGAFADVENALIIREKLIGQIQAQERLVAANREYERLARLLYDEGYAAYLTVLNAQQQLFPSELNLTQLRASLLVSYVNLYKAMGGGWVTEADKLTGAGGQPVTPPQTTSQK
ncbi:efflux transporter outer membrane subunit [Geobacter sp. SVR]|uniref:efflux transporter outer membrane subunit n=1 Tax=Geobacter sp. SVR TaxID=2495594 RepID=UPI00143EF62E|nr:efflux transporter outer membrane subunit [Geobacter sp. SVR]BCS52898.1 RND transporter [Geobacter sp. SVR]GCF87520.1 outer membrane protein OprM [Geobacter sp. SVR]